jgi:cyclophilin family peptidyl-prolyl cis-trans isomerase
VQGLPGIRSARLRAVQSRRLHAVSPRPWRAVFAALLCALSFAAVACGDDEDDSGGSDSAGGGSAQATPEPAEPQTTEPADQGGCQEVAPPEPRPDGGAKKPTERLDQNATYIVTLRTSCGEIAIRLDQKTSPKTTASFAHLARTGFYDGTVFHRIVPGFVIQGGDPTGSGTGGPGYTTRDVPPRNARYVKGTVAMAKSPAEPPGAAGSQFYIVTAPDAGLPPEYALLGRVVRGQSVVDEVGRLGDPASGGAGTPLQPVVIEGAEVTER